MRYTAEKFKKDILKIFTATQIGYIKDYQDGSHSFNTSKTWFTFHVIKVNDDRYTVMHFRTPGEILKEFKKNSNKYLDKINYLKQYADSSNLEDVLKRWIKLETKTKYNSPENYYREDDLIPLYLKKVYQLTKKQLFDLLVTKNKLPMSYFEAYYGKMDEGEDISERVKHYKYGKWDIYLDIKTKRGFDEVQQLLDDVSKELSKKGYSKLCYGKIFLVGSLGNQSLADYDPENDDIRVSFKVMKKKNRCSQKIALIHEIGHRNYYKFLSPKQRGESDNKFFTEVKLGTPKRSPQRGEIVTSKSFGDRYKVERREFKRTIKYIVRLIELGEDTRSKTKDLNQLYMLDDKLMGIEYIPEGKEEAENTYVPRPYGMKDKLEFYAVLWEFWFQDKLKDPAKTWFENLE